MYVDTSDEELKELLEEGSAAKGVSGDLEHVMPKVFLHKN
jgi:hypothetical protein